MAKTKKTFTLHSETYEILDGVTNKSQYIDDAVKEKHLNDLSKTTKVEAKIVNG